MKGGKKLAVFIISVILANFMLPFFPIVETALAEGNMNFEFNDVTGAFDGWSNDVKANPNAVRYVTVGWTITKVDTNGNPLAYDHGIMLDNDSSPGFQVRELPVNAKPGDPIQTFFSVPRSVVEQAIKDANLLDIEDGYTVYISSIFRIENSPKNAGKLFYTLNDILAAENWSAETRANLKERFDNPVTYYSPIYEGNAIIRLVHSDSIIENLPAIQITTGKAGKTFSHTFDETIQHNGKTYVLYKSYIQRKLMPGEEKYPQYTGDPALRTRNTTIAVGGTNIIGVYRELSQKPDLEAVSITNLNPVVAGEKVNFRAEFRNNGATIPSSQKVSFKITNSSGTTIQQYTQNGMATGETVNVDFSYPFTTAAQTFTATADPDQLIDESNESNNSVTRRFTPVAYAITGDFDILPSSAINYRDTFTLRPKDFVIPDACTYQYHEYRIEKDGIYWISPPISGQFADTSYSYSSYPPNVGVGSNFIQIRITAVCGETGQTVSSGWTAGKFLIINSPANNRPPIFSAGFFKEYNRTGWVPDYEVVVGSRVNLRIINDPTKDPAWPYDPDGDSITYTWLFESSDSAWIRSLPEEYGLWRNDEAHYNLIATEEGYHSVTVIARDPFGGESRRTAYIYVVPPNPIPIIDGPTEVKENRPLPYELSGRRSYSPAGNRIVEYIWQNKKDRYTEVGTETILLDVVDDKGLRSLAPAVHTLTVIPDEPPTIEVDPPPLAIRDTPVTVVVRYDSPDGDEIVNVTIQGYYDSNNNGIWDAGESFSFDLMGTLPGELVTQNVKGNEITFKKLSDTSFQFSSSRVGKVYLGGEATEDYGKKGYTEEYRVLDVINQEPSVSFEMEGKNEQPVPNLTTTYNPNQILANWSFYKTNTLTALEKAPYSWYAEGNGIAAGMGVGSMAQRFMQHGYSYQNEKYSPPIHDNGFGPNGISPYKGIASRDLNKSQPVLLPQNWRNMIKDDQYVYDLTRIGEGLTDMNEYKAKVERGEYPGVLNLLVPVNLGTMLRSNASHVYFDVIDGLNRYVFALNKNRIPNYSSEKVMIVKPTCCSFDTYLWHQWENNVSPYDFMIYMPFNSYQKYTFPYYTTEDMKNHPTWEQDAISRRFEYASSTVDIELYVRRIGYEIAGKTIYFVQHVSDKPVAYRDWSGVFYPINDPQTRNKGVDLITTYDAATGEQISFAEIPRSLSGVNTVLLSTKGDHLLMYGAYGNAVEVSEINRKGEIVDRNVVRLPAIQDTYSLKRRVLGSVRTSEPEMFTCSFSVMKDYITKDDLGNHYMFASNTCIGNESGRELTPSVELQELNPEMPFGLYVFQIKADGKLGFIHKVLGDRLANTPAFPEDNFYEPGVEIVINRPANQMYVRTFVQGYWSNQRSPITTVLNMANGSASEWNLHVYQYHKKYYTSINYQRFYLTPTGQVVTHGQWVTYTATGHIERPNWHENQEVYYKANNAGVNYSKAQYMGYGELVGDGMYVSTYQDEYGYGRVGAAIMFLDVGTPRGGQNGLRLGQLMSQESRDNFELTFYLNMYQPRASNDKAGFSFRMKDPRNRYSVETDGTHLYLAKYVNGARSVLASSPFPFLEDTNYEIRVKALGSSIDVFLDGVKYFSVTDLTFSEGKFGPFTDKPLVTFSHVTIQIVQEPDVEWMSNYAIWEDGTAQAEVRYKNIVFEDPEDDPKAGTYQWSIQHTPKFLNNQGLSELHGKTFTEAVAVFDKVGTYRVSLKAQDDPHPDFLYPSSIFAEYRKNSNEFWQFITVHRRPVAQFTLSINPDNHHVVWHDSSYDPDRWISPTEYSTEQTGIDYSTTRGILERKYFYVTPSGEWVDQKLITPDEVGIYRVGMQVKDEYGAWSYWAEQQIEITVPADPNQPPVAGFTITPSTGYRGTEFRITSTAYDPEDGPAAKLQHAYYIRNVTISGTESLQSTNRGTWTKTFNSLGEMEVRQVVTDSEGATDQFVRRITVVNRPPIADFNWSPVELREGDRIYLNNLSMDPDGDILQYEWTIVWPDGRTQKSSLINPTIEGTIPGNYRVTLKAADPFGAESSSTKTITVLENIISSVEIRHIQSWIDYYNENGLNTATFMAGEPFDVLVTTSPAVSVTVEFQFPRAQIAVPKQFLYNETDDQYPDFAYTFNLTSTNMTEWRGEGWRKYWIQIPDGTYRVVITAHFPSGTPKTHVTNVQIRGHILEGKKEGNSNRS